MASALTLTLHLIWISDSSNFIPISFLHHRKDFTVDICINTPDMKSKILAVLLLLSILTNIYLIQIQPSSKDLLEMKDKINQLEIANSQMSKQIYMDNLSMKNYASQLDLYRE